MLQGEFKCIGCGSCCRGFPGYVWINRDEIEKISKFLNLEIKVFLQKFCRESNNKIALKEWLFDYSCIFLKENRCTIYPVRPLQCKTFPFWKEIVSSKENLESYKKICPQL